MSTQRFTDRPKLFADPAACAAQTKQLREQHIAPLTVFVEALRAQVGPRFKHSQFRSMGWRYRCRYSILTRSYRPKAVLSGFVSRNNPDETAKNFFQLNAEAKIPRKRTVTWNVVPWYIGNSKGIRAAKRTDLEQGAHLLPKLLSLLPKLRTVVFVGRKSENA